MLVLSRKVGESIVIDDDIVITVLDLGGGRVSLGIQAPRDKTIYRRELYEAIQNATLGQPVTGERALCAVG